MKKLILSTLSLFLINSNLQARYTCCVDTQDTVMCTQFENLKTCNKNCLNMCVDIQDNVSGELID